MKETILKLSEDWKNTARGTKRPSDATDENGSSDHEVEGLLDNKPEKRADVPDSEDELILVEHKPGGE
jgi:hypothetical protein